jgi:hypothetical protein
MSFNTSNSDWQVQKSKEHPFIKSVRKTVLKYRLQSASHFSVPIEVSQATHPKNPDMSAELSPESLVLIGFYDFGREPLLRACRPKSGKRSRKNVRVLTGDIEIFEGDRFVSLQDFLGTHFPTFDTPVGASVMSDWWNEVRFRGETI